MRLYFYRTPWLLKRLYQPCLWKIPTDEKTLYLTFDDGPVPEATPYVLEMLASYNAQATFFVVGENVDRYPALFEQVVQAGHAIGNHTYNHLKGWSQGTSDYIENVQQCQTSITQRGYKREGRPLFRPPYGRITTKQLEALSTTYDIVMWELLSGDFDLQLNQQSSWRALKAADAGDILVFHDSQKYLQNVKDLLPKFLNHFSELGYTFAAL